MASTASRPTAGSTGLVFILVASALVLTAALLASFRIAFASDVQTLLAANGARVLFGATMGAALALSGTLRLAAGGARPWQDFEMFALSAGAAGGGFLFTRGRSEAAALLLFPVGAIAGGLLFYRVAHRLDRPRRWTNLGVAAALAAMTGVAALAGSYARERLDFVAPVTAWMLGDLNGASIVSALVVLALTLLLGVAAMRVAAVEDSPSTALVLAYLAFGLAVGAAGPLAFVSLMVPLAVQALARGSSRRAQLVASAAAGAATVVAVDAVPRLLVGGYDFPWNVPAGMLAIPGFLVWNRMRLRREAGRAGRLFEAFELLLIAGLTAGGIALALLLTRTIQILT
jgi:iron complex transport system permease protein